MTKNKKNHHPCHKTEEKCCEKKEVCLEKEASCACSHDCKCGDNCKCASGCKGSASGKTVAKCLTMLVGSLMISTSILFVGMDMSKPQIAQRAGGNLDLQITDYMRRNVPIVAQILESHQEKIQAEKAAEAEKLRLEEEAKLEEKVKEYTKGIISDPSNYSLGNKDGKYVIIEFFDYRCGWCKKTNKAIWDEIAAKKAPNVRWIAIDVPIFGEPSALISRYVLAAGKQGKYTEMHHAVSSYEKNLDENALIELAKKIGLDIDKLKKDASSTEIKEKIDDNVKMAGEIGVRGVPFMIVNGKAHGGALFGETLKEKIEESNKMK